MLKIRKGNHPDNSVRRLFGNKLEFSLKDLLNHTEKIKFTLVGNKYSFKVLDQGTHTVKMVS